MCKWFKDDEEIDTSIHDSYEYLESEDNFTLIIKSAKPTDAGLYYAKLCNDVGTISSNKAQLVVKCKIILSFL